MLLCVETIGSISHLHMQMFLWHVSRCLLSWMSLLWTRTRRCSGRRRRDGSSLRRMWRRRPTAGGNLMWPRYLSAACWSSERQSHMVGNKIRVHIGHVLKCLTAWESAELCICMRVHRCSAAGPGPEDPAWHCPPGGGADDHFRPDQSWGPSQRPEGPAAETQVTYSTGMLFWGEKKSSHFHLRGKSVTFLQEFQITLFLPRQRKAHFKFLRQCDA